MAKPISIKGAGGKCGGGAWKAVELITGDLRWVTEGVTEDIARCSDGMAEVSRGRSSRSSGEGPNDRKGQ
jgi:hypothetical protein